MHAHTCPNCGSTVTKSIHATTSDMHVSYFRCDDCGHVWTTTKDGSRIVSHVTPLTSKSKDADK